MLNGLVDYFLCTGSSHCLEIIGGVREPHDKHLFDKLSDCLRHASLRSEALSLLSHVVRRQPSWLYKISQHSLLKDLLKLLKVESDAVVLLSALLILVSILPVIPSYITPYLNDIFDIFSRVAAMVNEQRTVSPETHPHLHVALYAFFQRLYGMYPCNFLSYLRQHYSHRQSLVVFTHIVKPMLDRVRLHPLLVTASKEAEAGLTRWKHMETHDIVVECARISLDAGEADHPSHQLSFLSQLPSSSSSIRCRVSLSLLDDSGSIRSSHSSLVRGVGPAPGSSLWTPSSGMLNTPPPYLLGSSEAHEALNRRNSLSVPHTPLPEVQGGISLSSVLSAPATPGDFDSPPEAAIEATPENTPLSTPNRELERSGSIGTKSKGISSAARNLQFSLNSGRTESWQASAVEKRLMKLAHERQESFGSRSISYEGSERRKTDSIDNSEALEYLPLPSSEQGKYLVYYVALSQIFAYRVLSPVKFTASAASGSDKVARPVPTPATARSLTWTNMNEAIFLKGIPDTSEEDAEVCHIIGNQPQQKVEKAASQEHHQSEQLQASATTCSEVQRRGEAVTVNRCDSVIHDKTGGGEIEAGDGMDGNGSPEPLHGPPLALVDLMKRIHRLRCHSHCVPSAGEEEDSVHIARKHSQENTGERGGRCRALSNPDTLFEKKQVNVEKAYFLSLLQQKSESKKTVRHSSGTQTVENQGGMAYDHLFPLALPPLHCPRCIDRDSVMPNISELLDNYLRSAVEANSSLTQKSSSKTAAEEAKTLRETIQLLHIQLQFEKHKRELYAERARRLQGKAKEKHLLTEQNAALQDQLAASERTIQQLKVELEQLRQQKHQLQRAEHDLQVNNALNLQGILGELQRKKEELNTCEHMIHAKDEALSQQEKDLQKCKAELWKAQRDLKNMASVAEKCQKLEKTCEEMETRLLFQGEWELVLQDQIDALGQILQSQDSRNHVSKNVRKDAASQEVIGMWILVMMLKQLLDAEMTNHAATKNRLTELENSLVQKDITVANQKRLFKNVKEESNVKIQALEEKYRSMCAINQTLESQLLQVMHRLDTTHRSLKQSFRNKKTPSSDSIDTTSHVSSENGDLGIRIPGAPSSVSPPTCSSLPLSPAPSPSVQSPTFTVTGLVQRTVPIFSNTPPFEDLEAIASKESL
ncbi:unnamed protein product [Darwinula stevensoni]|uniref:Hamartin n=1 Tax=Darwinula stevensoni TaxID=69355 RepID=A0A7R8X9M6_9CRUS|nr:unnamed protein product [Darwinula stevensoni]CAG0884668.1 unnamed protein product [Darwinula stevensoni]